MENNPQTCHNCTSTLQPGDKFCRTCGQEAGLGLLSVRELLGSFWTSVFNLDNTVFKTLKYIWAPWKLSRFYVEGKRKAFLHPVRLFLITLLFHFGYIVSITDINQRNTHAFDDYKTLEKSQIYEQYLSVKNTFPKSAELTGFSDSIEHKIFKNTRLPEKDTFKIENLFNLNKFPITRKDAIELPIDSVYTKYNITAFTDKLLVKQMIRLNLDRPGMIKFAIGNAAWGILVVIALLAWFFKLLYFRKKMHYVEHAVLLMQVHSFCFIINTFILFLYFNKWISVENEEIINALILLFSPVYLFITLKLYYKQGWMKTFIKFIITSFFYLILGFMIILMVSLGSLIFF